MAEARIPTKMPVDGQGGWRRVSRDGDPLDAFLNLNDGNNPDGIQRARTDIGVPGEPEWRIRIDAHTVNGVGPHCHYARCGDERFPLIPKAGETDFDAGIAVFFDPDMFQLRLGRAGANEIAVRLSNEYIVQLGYRTRELAAA